MSIFSILGRYWCSIKMDDNTGRKMNQKGDVCYCDPLEDRSALPQHKPASVCILFITLLLRLMQNATKGTKKILCVLCSLWEIYCDKIDATLHYFFTAMIIPVDHSSLVIMRSL
ncbi:hypothetical protein BH20BAC1_BH20BAC1_25840 [soil metagenome]